MVTDLVKLFSPALDAPKRLEELLVDSFSSISSQEAAIYFKIAVQMPQVRDILLPVVAQTFGLLDCSAHIVGSLPSVLLCPVFLLSSLLSTHTLLRVSPPALPLPGPHSSS